MNDPEESDRIALGEKLKEARDYLGFSQDETAAALQVNRAAISLIESGQRKVSVTELKKFAQLYQRPVSYFTGELITATPMPASMSAFARKAGDLSDQDWEELTQFAEYLKSRAQQKRSL